ncbi:hypothetical protein Cyrtocomes_00742 [Candidatus Cyrtobacter comes]|uniref:Tetratricopeptide repeat-like domain-containing protein n=1 Tax=Candidatus Cyrtobacter comes TaxID=675776 RepID=A0ABU5L8A8_9RICK|nr:hypothetical protein [Candidatus Cyrtobacter comes]MDZ5762363.1 hypothetical protein [Candidatus Cyrtobacter comes]
MENINSDTKINWQEGLKTYYKVITLFILLCIITLFLFLLYRANVDTKIMNDFAVYLKASDLSNAIKAEENINVLDKLSSSKSIAGDFTKIKIASHYFNTSQYNKAAYYYLQQYTNKELAEYAKMMSIISKRKSDKIMANDALEDLSHISAFDSVTSVLRASILISQNRKDEARIILDNSKLAAGGNIHLTHIINLLLTNCV